MEVCKTCGQTLPRKAKENCFTHEVKAEAIRPQTEDPEDLVEEYSIEFGTFESPLQGIKEKDGFLTIKTDGEERTNMSCSVVRQRVDDVIDMSKYYIYPETDNCKIILTGKEDDVPEVIISFKTRKSFERCFKALSPFRPHLNSSAQHNRRSPSTNPRLVHENRTVTFKTLHKLHGTQLQPELVTLDEVNISSVKKWKDEKAKSSKRASDEISHSSEGSDKSHGQSDEERSSSGSELDMSVGELRVEDVDPAVLRGGDHAREKRNTKTVNLTRYQLHALQVKQYLNPPKHIITRGGTYNHVTLLEGDEIMKVNGKRFKDIQPETYSLEGNSSPESLIVTVRFCPGSISASNIPNNVDGLGITWTNTVVEGVNAGPLTQDSVFQPLRHAKGTFCLTHVNGIFIPFHTTRTEVCHLLRNSGERVDLVFQSTERMRAMA